MKKHLYILTLSFFIFSFISCDKIDNPIIPVNACVDGCSASPTENYNFQKAVFIEEFTGITCNNCPLAAEEGKKLKADKPGQVVVLAIHASNFAVPAPAEGYDADFRTTAGTEYYDFVAPFGVPSGTVDRLDQGTQQFAKPYQLWETRIDDIIANSATADVGILALPNIIADAGDTTICLEVKFKSMVDLSGVDVYWTAYVTEGHIKAQQKMPDLSKNKDYIHEHVLRTSFNGTFGNPIPDFDGSLNSTYCDSRVVAKDPSWKAENLEVIVIAYNHNTYEVLQVVEIDL